MVTPTTTRTLPSSPAHHSPASGPGVGVAPDGKIEKTEILDFLSKGETRIAEVIRTCRGRLSAMREDEASYFNFINAENTLGMSAWWLGRPASSFRYDAARQYVSALEDIRFNIYTIRAHIEAGESPFAKPSVRKFIESPVGRTLDWRANAHFTLNDTALAGNLVSLANRYNSEDMAILTARIFQNNALLPDGPTVFWNDYGRDLTNATVSLHQLAGYASGAAIGVAIARSTALASGSIGALKAMGNARYLLPGTSLFSTTASKTWNLHWLPRGLANFGLDFARFQVYAAIGYVVAGRDGLDVAGAMYLGGVGVATGFAQGWLQKLAKELAARDAKGALATWLLKDEMASYARVSLAVELAPIANRATGRLMTAKHARPAYEALTGFQQELVQLEEAQILAAERAAQQAAQTQRQLAAEHRRLEDMARQLAAREVKAAERIARQETQMRAQIQKQLGAIDTLAESLSADRAQALTQSARAAAEGPNLQEALVTLRNLIDTTKAGLAVSKKPTPRASQAVTPPATPAVRKTGTRAERMASYVPSKGLSPSVQNLVSNPPDALEDVMDVLGGRLLTVDSSCHPLIDSMYRNGNLDFKRLVVLRLSELQSTAPSTGTQWKVMPGTERRLWEGSIGTQHKLMVRYNSGGFMSGNAIWTVVSIRTTSAKSAARAATPAAPFRSVTP